MRNRFEEQYLVSQRDMIKEHQMLMNLAHVSHVGDDRQSKFSREQAYCQELGDACKPGAIGLDKMQRPSPHHIFKKNAVGDMFAKRDSSGCDCLG